jgi:preprotein translocase subunit SecB
MRPSPLQLERYFFPEVALTANKEFKPEEFVTITDEHVKVEHRSKLTIAESRQWECTLRIQFQAPPEANAPYAFVAECVGLFKVASAWPAERDEWLVKTNAPAVLFGMAREYVRSLMCAGPFSAILLPTVNFTDAAEKAVPSEKSAEAIAAPSARS